MTPTKAKQSLDSAFSGFGKAGPKFFQGLERDNSKSYFEAQRAVWEVCVRDPLLALLLALRPTFGGEAKLFRQNHSARFGLRAAPYKVTTYGVLYKRPGTESGLYVELSSKGLYCGGGFHDMAKDQLKVFHAAVDDAKKGAALTRAIEKCQAAGLTLGGQALKTVPRGFAGDHPRAILLKHKALVAGASLSAKVPALYTQEALAFVRSTWRALAPLSAWLDEHVGPSAIPPEVRWGGKKAQAG
jgi:uncharacterized protein (DUF2461 family)